MTCEGCGNAEAWRIQAVVDARTGERFEVCNSAECGQLGNLDVPDVYFRKPYNDPNLVNHMDVKNKNGVWVESKRHKAMLMREKGVVEAGDKSGGGRVYDRKMAQGAKKQGFGLGV